MFFKENLIQALDSIRSNKMRSFLTMLGIIIGIASVIGILTVGDALTKSVTEEMNKIGTNNFLVMIQEKDEKEDVVVMGPRRMDQTQDKDLLTNEMIQAYEENFGENLAAVSLGSSVSQGQIRDGRLWANNTLYGASPGYVKVNNLELLSGRFLNDSDLAGVKRVAVISDKAANKLFPSQEEALGKEIKYYDGDGIQAFAVVGVYKYEESAMLNPNAGASDEEVETNIYVPVSLVKQTALRKNHDNLMVMSSGRLSPEEFKEQTESFFNRYYKNNNRFEVGVMSMSSMIASATSMMSTISMAISVIAAISLLVGGIGVMNIMLVSVTERTREIGIRKALGAKNNHIRMQFITEAMIISLIGGLIGLLLGLGFGLLGSTLMKVAPSFSLPTILFTILFSMAIGVFFGYYPANKAAKLNPIDALRYE